MPGPVVSVPIGMQVVPEHCWPLLVQISTAQSMSPIATQPAALMCKNCTFLGNTDAPMSVKTVAPPACTSLICRVKEEMINHPPGVKSHTHECSTDIEEPGGDPVSCAQLFKSIWLIFLGREKQKQNTAVKNTSQDSVKYPIIKLNCFPGETSGESTWGVS